MHSKPASNNNSPSKDPVALKRSKTEMSNNNNNATTTAPTLTNNECFWNITKASNHPVIITKINRLRRKDTDSKLYRELMYEIGTFLAYEATSDLNLTEAKTVRRCKYIKDPYYNISYFRFKVSVARLRIKN